MIGDLNAAREAKMKVKVYPYKKGHCYGNIMWEGKFPMRGGNFPANHPVRGKFSDAPAGQSGSGAGIAEFRMRGYWASCFPEGDGITWQPEKGQSDEQCLQDIRESFGWDADWATGVHLNLGNTP